MKSWNYFLKLHMKTLVKLGISILGSTLSAIAPLWSMKLKYIQQQLDL